MTWPLIIGISGMTGYYMVPYIAWPIQIVWALCTVGACLPTYLPAYLPAYLRTCLPTYLPTYLHTPPPPILVY